MKLRISLVAAALLFLNTSIFAQSVKGYSLSKGKTFTVSSEINQDIEQIMLGQTMKTTQKISTVDVYEVVAVTDLGYRLKITGLSRKLDLVSPQGNASMDSELEGDDHLALRALSGKSYFVDINRQGKVLGMEGLEEMHTAIRNDLKGTALEFSAGQLISPLNQPTLTTTFESQFYIYPPDGIDQLTKKEEIVVNNLPISVDLTYSWSDDNTIVAKGNLSLKGDINIGGIAMVAVMEGEQAGTHNINAVSGLSTSIETEQILNGELQVQGTSVPMKIKSKVVVTIAQ